MDDERLMTVGEFNAAVRKWAIKVEVQSRSSLDAGTHGSRHLANNLLRFVDSLGTDKPVYKVAYRFDLYGIYRRWGAGRGYKIKFMNEPGIDTHLRITLGRPEQNRLICDVIKKVATENK